MVTAAQTDEFTRYRPLLFSIAYRMLGVVADAEDMVQETYLRWSRVGEGGEEAVASPKSWLTTVITRLCIDQLRSARARREEYVGPWLPEPLLTDRAPDPAEGATLADSLSLAFLAVLERLNPVERAIFLLHDIFGYEFTEIAPIVGKTAANCRQLARRAREHIAAQRPRFQPAPEERERLTRQFLDACASGDLPGLVATLADDITLWSDGGGHPYAARRPVYTADKVARFLLGILRKAPPGTTYQRVDVNGQPGFLTLIGGAPYNVAALDIADGRIRGINIVVNPDKLGHVRDGKPIAGLLTRDDTPDG